MADQAIVKPQAHSPYAKRNKKPFQYSPWVREGKIPLYIQQELQQTRDQVSAEQRAARLARGGAARERRSALPLDPAWAP